MDLGEGAGVDLRGRGGSRSNLLKTDPGRTSDRRGSGWHLQSNAFGGSGDIAL